MDHQKKSCSSEQDFFIQSEGLVCDRRQAYVISEAVCNHSVFSFFGLVTYRRQAQITYTTYRDHIPLKADFIQGSALILLN